MRLAAFPPSKGDLTNMLRSYLVKCEKAGVRIVMNHPVTTDFIAAQKPDAVVVQFYPDGVEYESPDGTRHQVRGDDTVMLSMGYRNHNPFGDALDALGALQTGLGVRQEFCPGPKGRNTGIYYTWMGLASCFLPFIVSSMTTKIGEQAAVYTMMGILLVAAVLSILGMLYLVSQYKHLFGKSVLVEEKA